MALALCRCWLPAQTASAVRVEVDWADYMARQDPVWDRLPADYFEGAFVGNGLFGAILFQDDVKPNTLRLEIGRSDVYDHRTDGTRLGHAKIRLPIGQLLLTPVGKILKADLRTDLWNAEIRGDLKTAAGTVSFRCFVPSGEEVIVLNLKTTGGEDRAECVLRPQQGDSQRHVLRPLRDKGFVYVPNPPWRTGKTNGMEVVTQPLLAGSDYSTAWTEVVESKHSRRFLVTVANPYAANTNRAFVSKSAALEVLEGYRKKSVVQMESAHRAWWHAFYPASFVSVPEARLESFYWIQLYKLASATRADGPVIDLMGPWFKPSIWAALWMNLNVQLTYSTLGMANHLDLADPLFRLIERHQDQLAANVPESFRSDCSAVANPVGWDELSAPVFLTVETNSPQAMNLIVLPWLMREFYQHNQFSMDETRLRDTIYPLLRRTFNVYLRILHLGEDGRYHVPYTYSDEYGNAPDTSLNLALAKWGFQVLIATAQRLQIADPLLPRWRELLAKMADYPVDPATGIMIGDGVPFAKTHRHYSHLFAIWPLGLMNADSQPDQLPLMRQSIQHFTGLTGDNCMFKYTGASSLWAALGDGDNALKWLDRSLEILPRKVPVPTVGPNTLYSENGWPTFESPVAASRNILDMLLQSGSGTIRVFPALPTGWRDAAFCHLRAEGAFLVSALRQAGKTRWVEVESLAGEPCVIQTGFEGAIRLEGPKTASLRQREGLIELTLKRGERVVLYTGERPKSFVVQAPAVQVLEQNQWGVRSR